MVAADLRKLLYYTSDVFAMRVGISHIRKMIEYRIEYLIF